MGTKLLYKNLIVCTGLTESVLCLVLCISHAAFLLALVSAAREKRASAALLSPASAAQRVMYTYAMPTNAPPIGPLLEVHGKVTFGAHGLSVSWNSEAVRYSATVNAVA